MSVNPGRRRVMLALAAPALGGFGPGLRAQTAPSAPPPELAEALPGARLQGSRRLRYFAFHVYDIRLWSGAQAVTAANWAEQPLALELLYARKLAGRQIAERSLEEMKRQGDIGTAESERWLAAMIAAFPDVADGDRLTGVQLPGQGARFFFNGRLRSELMDATFARRFFGVWLAPESSEPAMREALLGPVR